MRIPIAGPFLLVGLVATGTPSARADEPARVTARLASAGTLSVVDARGWLGRADGAALEPGIRLDASLVVDDDANDLRARLTVTSALAAAPDGDAVVKGTDGVVLDARWVSEVLAWFGPFVRAGGRASLFRAADDRETSTTWRIERTTGRVESVVGERLALTDPLRPVTLHQSVGAAIRPVRTGAVEVDLHAGMGGRETFADAQLAVADDRATPSVEVVEARDAVALGGVGGLSIAGALEDELIRYRLRFDATFPVVHTDPPRGPSVDPERGPLDLASVDTSALVSLALGPFASIDYEFEAVREPLVIDAFQFRGALRLSFGVSVGNERPASWR